jgi:hypothetical protein
MSLPWLLDFESEEEREDSSSTPPPPRGVDEDRERGLLVDEDPLTVFVRDLCLDDEITGACGFSWFL